MATQEGWLLQRGSAESEWLRKWCVLDHRGFRSSDGELEEWQELPLGPGSRASRFTSIRAVGDSSKYRTSKPFGFAVDLNLAAGKGRPIHYFDAKDAEQLFAWLSALEGWIKDSVWQAGDIVCVRESFKSDSEEEQLFLQKGSRGVVVEVDADGDTKIDFPFSNARQWVFEKNQHKICLEKDLEPKEVFLEIVPQNDVVMHWALRVGSGILSRCYEFESNGLCISWRTMLDQGYDITKQRLGVTQRRSRDVVAWAKRFGQENCYDAAGNGLLGGKNCQDFVLELCPFLGIDAEQLPYRQAEKVKTVLGAGALVAADAALGTGLLAAAVDAGGACAAVMSGAAAGPVLVAAAAVATVVAGTGMLASESMHGYKGYK